jgi:magnesium transporter
MVTLMAGIWGMNFDNTPELHVRAAYPLALGSMTVVAGVLYAWLKRSGWL